MRAPSVRQPLSLAAPASPLSSRPKRTRISYFATLKTPTYAALRKESREERGKIRWPNTVYAKRFPPYRDWSTVPKFLSTRLKAMAEPMFNLGPGILIALGIWLWARRRQQPLFGRFGGFTPRFSR
jgi:hypothetical protein